MLELMVFLLVFLFCDNGGIFVSIVRDMRVREERPICLSQRSLSRQASQGGNNTWEDEGERKKIAMSALRLPSARPVRTGFRLTRTSEA